MRILKLLTFLLLPLLSSCTAEKYAQNQAATEAWLDVSKGTPSINVTGDWQATQIGWGGDGRFVQTGNRISGALGNYSVRGVVRGSTVYLAFISRGWTYYTAVLTKSGRALSGFYSSSVPYSSSDVGALTLVPVRY